MEKKLRNKLSEAIKSKNYDEILRLRNKLCQQLKSAGREDYLDELTELLDDLRDDKDKLRVALAHRTLGDELFDVDNYTKANVHFRQFLRLAKEAGSEMEKQRAYTSLGRCALLAAELSETESDRKKWLVDSFKHNLKGLDLAEKLQADRIISVKEAGVMKSRLKVNIALSYEIEGRVDKAEAQAQEAVDICTQHNCPVYDKARCLKVLANIKSKTDIKEALHIVGEAMKNALQIADELGKEMQQEVLETKAEIHLKMGDFALAMKCLCDAYNLKLTVNREQLETNIQMLQYIRKTTEELQNIDEHEYAQRKALFEEMADCCVDLKALPKAIDYYKKMLEYCELLNAEPKIKSAALVSIAMSYSDLRSYSKAIEYFERERELWAHEPKEECRSRINLASLYEKRGDPKMQLEHLELARSLAELSGKPSLRIEVLSLLQSYHRNNSEPGASPEGILSSLEDEIMELRGQVSESQTSEGGSQEMEEDAKERPYTKIDLSTIPELQSKDVRGGRIRQKITITKNEKGESQLHLACIKGNLKNVEMLVKGGHPVTCYDGTGFTPILEAANYGFLDIVVFLLDHGANINEQQTNINAEISTGYTPLIEAITNGHLDLVELLLDRNARVDLKTTFGKRQNALQCLDELYEKNKDNLSDPQHSHSENLERIKKMRERMVELLKKSGEKVEPSSSSIEPEFILGSGDESQKTVLSRRLQEVRRRPSQFSDSDTDHGQMRRRKQTQRLHYSDEDDTSPSRRRPSSKKSDDDDNPRPSTSTGRRGGHSVSEYRSAMENLKHRTMPTQPSAPTKYNDACPGLIPEEEANREWLEDDLGQGTSKRRRSSEASRLESSSRVKRTRRRSLASSSSSSRSSSPVILNRSDRAEQSPEVQRLSTPSPELFAQVTRGESDYHSSDGEELVYPEKPLRKRSPMKRSPLKRTPPKRHRIISSPKKVSPLKVNDENISVRVAVSEKVLLVPLNSRNVTFKALADEVAERYFKLEGMKPKLTLKTSDGAILSSEDPVSLILAPDDFRIELKADVVSLTLPPLPERYKAVCKAENIGEDEKIMRRFEESQATFEICLKNLHVEVQFPVIVKSLFKETALRTLNLSGCALQDDGLEKLCGVLKSLENLEDLNLSCNYITLRGLEHLQTNVSSERSLQTLRRLDLSHNSLAGDGIKTLAELLDGLKLSALNLKDCDLKLPDPDVELSMLDMEGVSVLDVSFNPLGCRGVAHLFGSLDAWKLKKLNLAYTSVDSTDCDESGSIAKELALLFKSIVSRDEQGGVLQELDLSGCDLQDVDIWEMLSAASECGIKIEHLKISCNKKLTSLILSSLMSHTPLLTKLTATGCPELYSDTVNLSAVLESLSINTKQDLTAPAGMDRHVGPAGYVRLVKTSN